jgi:hypothetical protein
MKEEEAYEIFLISQLSSFIYVWHDPCYFAEVNSRGGFYGQRQLGIV